VKISCEACGGNKFIGDRCWYCDSLYKNIPTTQEPYKPQVKGTYYVENFYEAQDGHDEPQLWIHRELKPPFDYEIGYGEHSRFLDPDITRSIRDPGLHSSKVMFTIKSRIRQHILEVMKELKPNLTNKDFEIFYRNNFEVLK